MGAIISFFFGVGVGVVGTVVALVVGALYGAKHVERTLKAKVDAADKEQRQLIVSAVAQRGESMVYPLEGISTEPALRGVGDANLCLRVNGQTISIYLPEKNSASGVAKNRSANAMQVMCQFMAEKCVLHQISSRRIEIEAAADGKTPVANVTFGTMHVDATRVTLNFVYRHEASEVYSRLVACGAGVAGSSVFLTRAMKHVPTYYSFLAGLPQQRISAATILLARVLGASNDVRALKPFILSKLVKKISKIVIPDPVKGKLEVAGISLGRNSPAVGEIRVVNAPLSASDGAVELAVDIEYSGGLEVSLNADVSVASLISVTLPSVTVTVKVLRLSGVLRLLLLPPPAKDMWIAFETVPDIKLGFAQRVNGGNSVVQRLANHIPDLSGIITDVVRNSLLEDMVLPNRDDVPLPILGETPPTTPAEPEGDGSVFDKFRHSHWRFGNKAAAAAAAASSPAGSGVGSSVSPASPHFGSPAANDDDVISQYGYNAAKASASTPATAATAAAAAAPAVVKKTIQVDAASLGDMRRMGQSIEAEAVSKKKAEEEAAAAAAKKKADEEAEKAKRAKSPSLLDRMSKGADAFKQKIGGKIDELRHRGESPAAAAAGGASPTSGTPAAATTAAPEPAAPTATVDAAEQEKLNAKKAEADAAAAAAAEAREKQEAEAAAAKKAADEKAAADAAAAKKAADEKAAADAKKAEEDRKAAAEEAAERQRKADEEAAAAASRAPAPVLQPQWS